MVEAARAGSPQAWEAIYQRFGPALTRYARSRGVRDPEDVTQDVLSAAASRIEQFSGDSDQFRAWLFSIAYRRCADIHRRRYRRPEHLTDRLPDHPDPAGPADERLWAHGEGREVAAALRLLDEKERNVVTLRVVGEMPVAEVSATTGLSRANVRVIQSRALAKMRRYLENNGGVLDKRFRHFPFPLLGLWDRLRHLIPTRGKGNHLATDHPLSARSLLQRFTEAVRHPVSLSATPAAVESASTAPVVSAVAITGGAGASLLAGAAAVSVMAVAAVSTPPAEAPEPAVAYVAAPATTLPRGSDQVSRSDPEMVVQPADPLPASDRPGTTTTSSPATSSPATSTSPATGGESVPDVASNEGVEAEPNVSQTPDPTGDAESIGGNDDPALLDEAEDGVTDLVESEPVEEVVALANDTGALADAVVTETVKAVTSTVDSVVDTVSEATDAVVTETVEAVTSTVESVVDTVAETTDAVATGASEAVSETLTDASQAVSSTTTEPGEGDVEDAVTDTVEGVTDTVEGVTNTVGTLVDGLGSLLGG